MKSKYFLMVAGLMLVLFSYSSAQVPQMINYQGKLTKASGAPLDTTVQMIFSIYVDSAGTSLKWTETQGAVAVEKGIFNVLLGSVNPIPDTVFNGNIRYLGVKVGGDPEITPRKPMVSVPYAYRAGSDGDWIISGSNMYSAVSGNVGIGTTSPNEQVEITGNLRLPYTSATAGIIKMGADRFIHNYGTNNTFVGVNAGNLTMTGGANTANGMDALYSNIGGYCNTANGIMALYRNTTGYDNTANGTEALSNNTTGFWNTAIGKNALYNNTTGFGNTALGCAAGVVLSGNLSNATAIGWQAHVSASNKVRIGNASVTVIEGEVDWSFPSDARLKTNVQESPLGLDFILKLEPITYNSLAQGQEGITYTGLIGQDVEKVLDELGVEFSGLVKPANKDDSYSLRYATFVMPLIKAIQEQQEQIKVLQKRIEELEKK